jgi:hypothetical protein
MQTVAGGVKQMRCSRFASYLELSFVHVNRNYCCSTKCRRCDSSQTDSSASEHGNDIIRAYATSRNSMRAHRQWFDKAQLTNPKVRLV